MESSLAVEVLKKKLEKIQKNFLHTSTDKIFSQMRNEIPDNKTTETRQILEKFMKDVKLPSELRQRQSLLWRRFYSKRGYFWILFTLKIARLFMSLVN